MIESLRQRIRRAKEPNPSDPPNSSGGSDGLASLDQQKILEDLVIDLKKLVMQDAALGELKATTVSALTKCLGELRQAKKYELAMKKERGEVIPKTIAIQVIGFIVRRLNNLIDSVAINLSETLEDWLNSDEFFKLDSSQRRDLVRNWLLDKFRSVRTIEADQVESIIDGLANDVIGDVTIAVPSKYGETRKKWKRARRGGKKSESEKQKVSAKLDVQI